MQLEESTELPAEVSVEIVTVYPLKIVGGDRIREEVNTSTLLGSTVALKADPADIFCPKISQVSDDFRDDPDTLVQVVVEYMRGE